MQVVGFTGKAGSGKDTAAKVLIEKHGFVRFAFVDHMKAVMALMLAPLGVTLAHFHDPELKDTVIPLLGKTPRQILLSFGTDWARDVLHPDIWVMIAKVHLKEFGGQNIVVTDIRLENEAEAIRAVGGVMVHIVGRDSVLDGTADAQHKTEAGIRPSADDIVIRNDKTIDSLHRAVEHALVSGSQDVAQSYGVVAGREHRIVDSSRSSVIHGVINDVLGDEVRCTVFLGSDLLFMAFPLSAFNGVCRYGSQIEISIDSSSGQKIPVIKALEPKMETHYPAYAEALRLLADL